VCSMCAGLAHWAHHPWSAGQVGPIWRVSTVWRVSTFGRWPDSFLPTPAAPLALARVQGVYDVTMTIESRFGISSFPGPANTGWRFAPVCDRGACDVEWRDTNAHELTTRLRRTEATYSGSDAGRFNLACQQTAVVSSLTLTLHVVRAKVVGNTWRATVLEGHVTQREDAQLDCRPSGIDYTARAVLYR
jgi:hypothetical protein